MDWRDSMMKDEVSCEVEMRVLIYGTYFRSS